MQKLYTMFSVYIGKYLVGECYAHEGEKGTYTIPMNYAQHVIDLIKNDKSVQWTKEVLAQWHYFEKGGKESI